MFTVVETSEDGVTGIYGPYPYINLAREVLADLEIGAAKASDCDPLYSYEIIELSHDHSKRWGGEYDRRWTNED